MHLYLFKKVLGSRILRSPLQRLNFYDRPLSAGPYNGKSPTPIPPGTVALSSPWMYLYRITTRSLSSFIDKGVAWRAAQTATDAAIALSSAAGHSHTTIPVRHSHGPPNPNHNPNPNPIPNPNPNPMPDRGSGGPWEWRAGTHTTAARCRDRKALHLMTSRHGPARWRFPNRDISNQSLSGPFEYTAWLYCIKVED